MDRAFSVPGTRLRFGVDGLLGLVPLGGDAAAGLIQAALVLIALDRYKVPPTVAARMIINVLLDIGVGAIPLLGDLFDFGFKANTRNMELLKPYLGAGRNEIAIDASSQPGLIHVAPARIPWGTLLAVGVALLGALILLVIGFVTVIRWLVTA